MKPIYGYISEPKVLLGLTNCYYSTCTKCPYYAFPNCRSRLSQEAITYISRLERKFLKYEKKFKS